MIAITRATTYRNKSKLLALPVATSPHTPGVEFRDAETHLVGSPLAIQRNTRTQKGR